MTSLVQAQRREILLPYLARRLRCIGWRVPPRQGGDNRGLRREGTAAATALRRRYRKPPGYAPVREPIRVKPILPGAGLANGLADLHQGCARDGVIVGRPGDGIL